MMKLLSSAKFQLTHTYAKRISSSYEPVLWPIIAQEQPRSRNSVHWPQFRPYRTLFSLCTALYFSKQKTVTKFHVIWLTKEKKKKIRAEKDKKFRGQRQR